MLSRFRHECALLGRWTLLMPIFILLGFAFLIRLLLLIQRGDAVRVMTASLEMFLPLSVGMVISTISTQDGGFAVLATSNSTKGFDKKNDSKGGSDFWLIRINEFGDELWQKTIGDASDEEARAVIQTTDIGFFVAGNVTLREPQGP